MSYILKALFRETPLAYRWDLVWLKGVLVMNALSIVYLLFCEVFSRKLQIFYCFIIFIFIASLYFIWSMDQKGKTMSRDAKKWQRNKTYLNWQNFVCSVKILPKIVRFILHIRDIRKLWMCNNPISLFNIITYELCPGSDTLF